MSAFSRLPAAYREQLKATAKEMGGRDPLGNIVALSPQNRRVRFAVDMAIARAKSFPNRVTRQQRRSR